MNSPYINVCNKSNQLIWACDNADQSRRKHFYNVPKGTPVVYFLVSNTIEIVYIGQTANLAQRISAHKATKQFDDVYWKSIPIEIAYNKSELEDLCLLFFNRETLYNKRYPDKKKYKTLKHNPIESFWFAKWVNEKIKEKKYRKERIREIESEYILRRVSERKAREKKSLCVY
jgi:hypothetical protein